jgi:long-chain acyl-CoA synthetase
VPFGEQGEIAVSGPQVVPGYWRLPEATADAFPDGELRTGDIGFMDADGWLYVVDRKKDMINASGFKVWPREVEDVLYTHPAVREAAVVGIPDAYRGESVKAFVSLRPGAVAEPEEISAYCAERLAAYKYPREVEVLPELPKTTSGKILRRELRSPA